MSRVLSFCVDQEMITLIPSQTKTSLYSPLNVLVTHKFNYLVIETVLNWPLSEILPVTFTCTYLQPHNFTINYFNVVKWIINVSGRQYQSLTWQIYFQDRVKHKYLSSVISVCTSACGHIGTLPPLCDRINWRYNQNARILSCLL